ATQSQVSAAESRRLDARNPNNCQAHAWSSGQHPVLPNSGKTCGIAVAHPGLSHYSIVNPAEFNVAFQPLDSAIWSALHGPPALRRLKQSCLQPVGETNHRRTRQCAALVPDVVAQPSDCAWLAYPSDGHPPAKLLAGKHQGTDHHEDCTFEPGSVRSPSTCTHRPCRRAEPAATRRARKLERHRSV